MTTLAQRTRAKLLAATGTIAPDEEAIVSGIQQLEAKVEWFEEQFNLARHRQFGPSSEQTTGAMEPLLFDEAEAVAQPALPEPSVEVVTYSRRKVKGKREAQLENLPVEDKEYRLPEEEHACPQCGNGLHEIGKEVRREIKIIPARVSVVNHVRFKYGCRHCQKEDTTTPVVTAAMPKPAFPNGVASPSSVAHVMTEKFVMGSPLYRQEQQLERNGFNLSRQTMANWMIKGAGWLQSIYDRLHGELIAQDIVHADETTLQVLKEAGRAAGTNSYMWVYRTGRTQTPIVLFDYQATRAAKHPSDFLDTYKGYLNADGYGGYDPLAQKGVTLVGCWAHARRKFDEACKALSASARKNAASPPTALVGLQFCNGVYKVEHDLKDVTDEQRLAGRLERSKPILDSFKQWLDAQAPKVLPKSALGGAIAYCRNQWSKLIEFLSDGRLEIDNNRAERSIKPFVIGRKNWLFANSQSGANASAVIYSIVETAKENGLNPFAYLEHLFEMLPNIDCDDPKALDNLLPWAEAARTKCRIPRAP